MSSGGSVTHWIAELEAGDEAALEKLRRRYWPFLVELAAKHLKGTPRRAADEEDVAQDAFWGFYRSFKNGRLPKLQNRHDLLALLTLITTRKAAHQVERDRRLKRGGGQERGESALDVLASSHSDARGIERVASATLGPDEQVMARDTYEHFVNRLPEDLRPIAEAWLGGSSHREIAKMLNCAVRTVDRKLLIILDELQKLAADSVNG
ncbi:MAG: RNA polymerase subunit sigma-70 [Planctomycetes bacterium]|nr:RNA polymerase subunit sigma-70 [Planctomycetota bacterium]